MNQIKQIVYTYLNAPTTDYAILLNGEWGSGKTFYLKNKLIRIEILVNEI